MCLPPSDSHKHGAIIMTPVVAGPSPNPVKSQAVRRSSTHRVHSSEQHDTGRERESAMAFKSPTFPWLGSHASPAPVRAEGQRPHRGHTELKGPFFCDKGLLRLRRRRQPPRENNFLFSSGILVSNDLVSYNSSGQDGFQFVGTVVDLNTLESTPKTVMLVGEGD